MIIFAVNLDHSPTLDATPQIAQRHEEHFHSKHLFVALVSHPNSEVSQLLQSKSRDGAVGWIKDGLGKQGELK